MLKVRRWRGKHTKVEVKRTALDSAGLPNAERAQQAERRWRRNRVTQCSVQCSAVRCGGTERSTSLLLSLASLGSGACGSELQSKLQKRGCACTSCTAPQHHSTTAPQQHSSTHCGTASGLLFLRRLPESVALCLDASGKRAHLSPARWLPRAGFDFRFCAANVTPYHLTLSETLQIFNGIRAFAPPAGSTGQKS